MNLKSFIFCFGAVLIISGCTTPKNKPAAKLYLHNGWQFKKTSDSVWLSASVPGNVHTDLYDNKQIPHPFLKENEEDLQWISEEHWDYSTTFSADEETLKKKQHFLHFDGIDTYAQVYFNDHLVLETNNAFRFWKTDVSSLIKPENTLLVKFFPTSLHEIAEAQKLPYTLPEGPRVFTRKAQFQYGWDWGPSYNTSGIWREVYLESHNGIKIEDVYIKQNELSDNLAQLSAEIEVFSAENDDFSVEIWVNNQKAASQNITRKEKNAVFEIPFEIKNPKRWWTHNLGEPYLYDISVLLKKDGILVDSLSLKKGLRTVELITEKDEKGETFYFKLNDKPVFMKGANYIPQNSFQNWVGDTHYENLLNDAVEANINMLRVWGGGIYENAVFYELCDEKGILVWQDFMFACAMYPGDDAFLENVRQEAVENVKRLRNHSSIALWCGNNESSEGWHRWGWQDGRSDTEKAEIWGNYLKVFDDILPNTVKELTDIPYWESSPKFGRGDIRYKTEGDAHDWWIWHDGHPFENLEKNVPRFMSEFGFQAFPHYETLKLMSDSTAFSVQSAAVKAHQKHRVGMETILQYMEWDFPVPADDEDYVYISQLLQAYGIGKGIEAHRRAKPYTMGSLYWQLNDCWPSVSWSGIDYLGHWKALHYQAKRSFKNLLVSQEIVNDTLRVFIVNDDFQEHQGILKVEVLDFNGNVLQHYSKKVAINPDSSKSYLQIPVKGYSIVADKIVFATTFKEETSLFYLLKPKELSLEEGEIQTEISKTDAGFQIKLQSKVLQKNVFLYLENFGEHPVHFSDNYFDLLPNIPKIIDLKTGNTQIPGLKVKTLNMILE